MWGVISKPFGIGLFGIGIILFFIAIYLWVRWYRQERRKTIAKIPSIKVQPSQESDYYYLEVKNVGGIGTFEADIQMIGRSIYAPFQFNHKACWGKTAGRESRIPSGQTDRIKVARKVYDNTPVWASLHLDLCYWNSQSSQEQYQKSSSYIVGAKNIDDTGKEYPMEKPEFTLSVTISAVEGLKEGSFSRQYRLTLGGLEELPTII